MDLSLANEGYRLLEGSVKPSGSGYLHTLKKDKLAEPLEPDRDGSFILKARQTYLFKLKERLSFPKDARIYGQATAKSSIGRLDVLARLIVDGMDCYETLNPEGVAQGNGNMYLEVTPMTFNVRAKEGKYLSQLRLFRGKPEHSEVSGEELYESLLFSPTAPDESLSVDLCETQISGRAVSAFCAQERDEDDPPIPLWKDEDKEKRPCPTTYWKFRKPDRKNRLKITKNAFYIIRSKERISLPAGIAVYCRATDETIGEMRIHYAGFVHPFFGAGRKDGRNGTPLIFEVRGHDVDVSLKDGEKMARLVFYRMSRDCERPKAPCRDEDEESYNEQNLTLSNIFADWPTAIDVKPDGTVVKAPIGG